MTSRPERLFYSGMQGTVDTQRGLMSESPGVDPPLVSSPTELPFREKSWKEFERLWQDLVMAEGFTDVHRFGRPGQSQEGVDFLGMSPKGRPWAFQVRQVAAFSSSDLRNAVSDFAAGSLAAGRDTFVIAMSLEANDRDLQDELNSLQEQHPFIIEIWDSVKLTHLLRTKADIVQTHFGEGWVQRFFAEGLPRLRSLDAEALLLGPVEALGLTAKVKEAQDLNEASPADAAVLYGEIAAELGKRYAAQADRFLQLRAVALKEAGDREGSHDLLMDLAIRDLFERAEPRVSPTVAAELNKLDKSVDEARQARGSAVLLFGHWHEHPGQLEHIAKCFDSLESDDPYAPYIAALVAEAALTDRAFGLVLDRVDGLRAAAGRASEEIALRVGVALGDAGVPGAWTELLKQAEDLRLPSAEGAYLFLRAARWCARNGEVDRAESFYRRAMKLAAEADLDLDVENALWSLTVLYSLPTRFDELFETNQLALSIGGSRSYVKVNSRTAKRSYQYLANGQLPDAHLWTKYRLLEAIRSGCLIDELNSHEILARIYIQSGDTLLALENAVRSGNTKLVKEIAPQVGVWPDFLADAVASGAQWVHRAGLLALEHVGDLAPPDIGRALVTELLGRLAGSEDDMSAAPELFKALGAVVLEATDVHLETLMSMLERVAPRKKDQYRLTDSGVMLLASRLYRFRPSLRSRAASVLGEMAVGAHTGEWGIALEACGDETEELIGALERVAARESHDVAASLADLGHMTETTRALWSKRLQFVEDHPLGQRSGGAIGPRYDVPKEFLKEQGTAVSHQYVDKLIAIGSNPAEMAVNRAAALESAARVLGILPPDKRNEMFERVQALTNDDIPISEMDQFNVGSQHLLSRFRFAIGSMTDVRTAAGSLLGRLASAPEECLLVRDMALGWVRSSDPLLQQRGAWILTLPNLSPTSVQGIELSDHVNPQVRRASPRLLDINNSAHGPVLEQLSSDSDSGVRMEVLWALSTAQPSGATYDRIRARLSADPSSLVRTVASEAFHSEE